MITRPSCLASRSSNISSNSLPSTKKSWRYLQGVWPTTFALLFGCHAHLDIWHGRRRNMKKYPSCLAIGYCSVLHIQTSRYMLLYCSSNHFKEVDYVGAILLVMVDVLPDPSQLTVLLYLDPCVERLKWLCRHSESVNKMHSLPPLSLLFVDSESARRSS